MRARRDAAIRMLKTMMVASVAIPVAIFGYASWVAYHERATRTPTSHLWANLGVMSEHTSRIVPVRRPDLRRRRRHRRRSDRRADQGGGARPARAVEQAGKGDRGGRRHPDHRRRRARAGVVGDLADPDTCRRCRPRLFPGAEGPRRRNFRRRGAASARAPRSYSSASAAAARCATASSPASSWSRSRRRCSPSSTPNLRAIAGGRLLAGAGDGMILARYPPAPDGMTRFGPQSGFMLNVARSPQRRDPHHR